MDSVTLITSALAAGFNETAKTAVGDAYKGLVGLLSRRFAGNRTAEVALAEYEQDPPTWSAPLQRVLRDSGVADNPDVIEAAQAIMRVLDEEGTQAGKYAVDLRGAQGVQVGDYNQQANVFQSGPNLDPNA